MDRRTSLISAASVVGILLAGSTAVAANVGILDQADESGLGQLSASAQSVSLEPQVIDVQLDPQTTVATIVANDGNEQAFTIEDAGVVTVDTTADGLEVAAVAANDGWSYVTTESSDGTVLVTFESEAATYVFSAALDADGAIAASVEQPITEFVTSPTPAPAQGTYDDDEYEEDEYEEDEHEEHEEDEKDEEDEEDEYEYEGREDDD